MASEPSSDVDPPPELGNIVSNNTIEEQARLFARYEQEKTDRELAATLARRISINPPPVSAAEPNPAPIVESSSSDPLPVPPPSSALEHRLFSIREVITLDDDDDDGPDTITAPFSTISLSPQQSLSDPGSSPIVIRDDNESQSSFFDSREIRLVDNHGPPNERRVMTGRERADQMEAQLDRAKSSTMPRSRGPLAFSINSFAREIITLDDDDDEDTNIIAAPPQESASDPGPAPIVINVESDDDEDIGEFAASWYDPSSPLRSSPTHSSASDPGPSPIVEAFESESDSESEYDNMEITLSSDEEEQPSASGPVNSQQNASGAVLRADPSSSGAVLRANNNPSSSSGEQPIINIRQEGGLQATIREIMPADFMVDGPAVMPAISFYESFFRDRGNIRPNWLDEPLLPREGLRTELENWANRVFSEPENVAARPRGILNIGARRSAANQENNEMETNGKWGECTICFSKPTDPMGCISCLQLVGCRLCCKSWVLSTAASMANASCPLCRKEWGKATEVLPMAAIKRRKRMKTN